MTEEKPLFVPLKTEHYEAFERGIKKYEYRLYGPRWNEKTCRIGRAVTLSKGYGKANRLHTSVKGFEKVDPTALHLLERLDIIDCYGNLDNPIAKIRMY